MLRVLPVCIGSCLELVMRYEYLVLDVPLQDTVYLREEAWLFVEAKMRAREKKLGNSGLHCKKPKQLLNNVPKCLVLNKD